MNSPSILDLKSISKLQIENLISRALKIKTERVSSQKNNFFPSKIAAFVFFEASTRTRCSFEVACIREGIYPMLFEAGSKTSLDKGETEEDTLRNLNSYHPDFFVLRSGDGLDMKKISHELGCPILNAGWGTQGHPTQALLDVLTIKETIADLQKVRLVFIGDVRSSRVFASHLELAHQLGYKVAVCAPKQFLPHNSQIINFESLRDSVAWATHFVFLRVQKERHQVKIEETSYLENYGASVNFMKLLSAEQFIMHPGPVNYGIEIEEEVTNDSRCLILKQAENGVPLRRAVIQWTLEHLSQERRHD